jgi:ABC-type sugar transport system substrate-binding protein
MKKVGKILLLGLVLLVAMQGLFAAGQQEAAASEQYTMVAIPKLRAAWFNALEKGMLDAAKEYGVDAYMQAPAAADEAQQVRLIEDAINQGVNSIMSSPMIQFRCSGVPACPSTGHRGAYPRIPQPGSWRFQRGNDRQREVR